MALKDNWTDKLDGIDDVLASDINAIANSAIELEKKVATLEENPSHGIELAQTLEGNEEDKAPSVKAVNEGLAGKISKSSLAQTFGDGEDVAISQKATTDELLKRPVKTEVLGKNLFNLATVSKAGEWADYTNGRIESNQYTTAYCHSDFIPVEAGEFYTHSGGIMRQGVISNHLYSYAIYDASKTFIEGAYPNKEEAVTLEMPENAAYIILNEMAVYLDSNIQFEKGKTATGYEPFTSGFYLDGLIVPKEQVKGLTDEEAKNVNLLHLPEKYDLVIGDKFELFYKGIMLCKDPYAYNILVTCPIGKAWGRKYEVTPTVAGTHTLTIKVSDDKGQVLDEKSTELVVRQKMTNPTNRVNVLCVGDSLTENGRWVDEAFRRLAKTNNVTMENETAPTGDGLSNIVFVGNKTTKQGAGYEGVGGWSFTTYLGKSVGHDCFWISCTHSKTDADQHSIYKDTVGNTWKLETIENSRIKVIRQTASGNTLPTSGTLTWESGGANTEVITYTNAIAESSSPFVYNGDVNFSAYCSNLNIDTIDVCYILLGWNDAGMDADTYKALTKEFVDHLIEFNPSMKVVLMGLQIPSLDGCANNYGATGIYADFRRLQEFVFNLDSLYSDVAKEHPNNVFSVNVSGQFDTEYNMYYGELEVNSRNTTKVQTQTNGVHPSLYGYYQIADVVYRHIHSIGL